MIDIAIPDDTNGEGGASTKTWGLKSAGCGK